MIPFVTLRLLIALCRFLLWNASSKETLSSLPHRRLGEMIEEAQDALEP